MPRFCEEPRYYMSPLPLTDLIQLYNISNHLAASTKLTELIITRSMIASTIVCKGALCCIKLRSTGIRNTDIAHGNNGLEATDVRNLGKSSVI